MISKFAKVTVDYDKIGYVIDYIPFLVSLIDYSKTNRLRLPHVWWERRSHTR